MAEKIGTTKCDCGKGATVEWSQTKTGGASGKCLVCGEQRFKRSPNAVEGLKQQLAGAAAASSSTSEPAKKGGVFGEPLDLGKL
jgi:hypothetical protein